MPKANWKKLEERMASLLSADSARTTPGSGNSKGEEDVVGKSTICQCKDSDQKNITILAKDIERLKNSASLLDKTPLFASRAGEHTVVSFLLDDDNLQSVQYAINAMIIMSRMLYVEATIDKCNNSGDLMQLDAEFDSAVKASKDNGYVLCQIRDKIAKAIKIKTDNATMYNLFGDDHVH